ncbi:MAG: acetyltransferase, partial [Bacillota bacterium]
MQYFDVFNGDADGICALHQLRLADPLDSRLVTGLKRDIVLLDRVPAQDGDVVTVLDISLARNRSALETLLERGVVVRYFDHHHAGRIPAHDGLETIIDVSGALCTSALVDRHLGGRFRAWAIAGAFGDAMEALAMRLANGAGFDADRVAGLKELGATLNYNAYGDSESDVLVPPADLYRIVSGYADPFELMQREPVIGRIGQMWRLDLERARELPP